MEQEAFTSRSDIPLLAFAREGPISVNRDRLLQCSVTDAFDFP